MCFMGVILKGRGDKVIGERIRYMIRTVIQDLVVMERIMI